MKLFKLTALSALLMITLSGCSLNSESPEQLIKEKPVYSEASLKLYKQIEKILPSLILRYCFHETQVKLPK